MRPRGCSAHSSQWAGGCRGRPWGTETVPWGSPSLHVAPESRNVCWQGVLGTRLTPLRVAAYQAQPRALRLPLTWPSEGPSPLLRGTTWVPCAGSILGLSSPGKPPAESGVNEADCPKAKRRLVRGRLVRAWRAAGLWGPGTVASWKPLGKPQWTGRFLQYKDLWGHLVQCAHFTDEELPKGTQWHSQARAAAQRRSDQTAPL